MTLPVAQTEARRRKRFSLPGRISLAQSVAVLEGIAAAILSIVLALVHAPLMVFAVALTAGITYGAFSLGAAKKFVPLADMRQPFALHAAVSWIPTAALAFVVALAVSRWNLAWGRTFWLWLLVSPLLLVVLRIWLYRQLATMLSRGQLQVERLALIGDQAAVSRLRSDPRIWKQGGQVITSLVLPEGVGGPLPSADIVGAFARSCLAKNCQHVLLLGDLDNLDAIGAIVDPLRPYALNVMLYPHDTVSGAKINLVDIVPLGSVNSVRLLSAPLNETGIFLKRVLDIVAAAFGILLLSPLLLAVGLVIRMTSDGPALYRQERRGFNGRNFYILKFRSMRVMEDGRAMRQAQVGDDRITPIGRFIRRTSIDELPQLINVLRGDMSLVGPRPHAISHDVELSSKFELYAQRQRIKPGITGWAQVNGYRGDTSTQDKIEGRTLHDLYYAENWSLLLDVWIVILTVFSARTRQNAH